MKELINVAEELCKQIDKAQVHLIDARLHNDRKGKKSAITEMETAMDNVSLLVKCLIKRKDNIVDLSEVWHDLSEPAYKGGYVLLCDHPKFIETVEPGQVIWGGKICPNAKYAFYYDLIPKVEDSGAS